MAFRNYQGGYVDNVYSGEDDYNDAGSYGGRFMATFKPSDSFSLTGMFIYNKLNSSAAIDEPTTGNERYLGWEPDFYLDWQATSDVTFVLRYGVFFPNADAFNGDNTARHYIYAGVTYAF